MKKTVMLLIAAMLLGTSVSAQIIKEDDSVSIEYTELGDKPFNAVICVFEPGADISDGKMDDSDMQKLFRMEQRNSAAEIKDNFTMRDSDPEGVYYVVIGGFEEEKPILERYDYFVHLHADTEVGIISELSSAADGAQLRRIYEKYDNFAWVLDKENEQYKQNIDMFYRTMYDNFKGDFVKISDAEDIFDKTCTLISFGGLKGAALIQAIEMLGLSDSAFYENNTEQVIALYEKYADKGSGLEELKATLAEAMAVTEVNMSDSDTVLDVIKKHTDIFSVNFEGDFKKVSEAQMARALYHKNFVRAKDVDDAFNKRLQQLISEGGKNTGGSVSGSGGSQSAVVLQGETNEEVIEHLKEKDVFFDMDECGWAADYIKGVYRRQIMIGSDGYFRPNDLVTREELVKIIVLAKELSIESNADIQFDDVREEDWFYQYVLTAVKNQIVFGVSETSFGTGATVSRQDAVLMLYRAFAGKDSAGGENNLDFTDSEEIAEYAVQAVTWMHGKNIISGFPDNTFRPMEGLSRAQAAKIISEFIY